MSRPKWDFFNWPDKIKVRGKMISPNISHSKASIVHRCSGLYKLQYEDKIKMPPSAPLIHGSYFDALCSGEEPAAPFPESEDIEIIKERYEEYKPFIVPGETQKPFQMALGFGTWIVIGFLDRYPNAIPDAPIIDVKFAQKPWTQKKADGNKKQATIYAVGLNHDWVRFDVANLKKPGIQQFEMWLSQQDKDRARAWLIDAAKMIVSGQRFFTPNKLCPWCDYRKMCSAVDDEGQFVGDTVKEAETAIDELSKKEEQCD
jgi:hypothetical protein